MKARFSQTELRMTSRLLVFAMCVVLVGAMAVAGQPKKTTNTRHNPPKAAAIHKSKKSARTTKRATVTGSNISYQIKEGSETPDTPFNLTVIDVSKAENRGYTSTMDILRRDPRIYPAYRRY